MNQIRDEVNAQARDFGIDVVDVRIRRADLPEANSQAVFARMRSEREREAKLLRAKGEEEAQRIRAGAERDRAVILAEARKKAQILRGEGDSESIRIYADAFGRDPEFFSFYRSMEAYREALTDGKTTLVLSPDSDFFRYFGSMLGK
jgi:membrane protease subunit HflC